MFSLNDLQIPLVAAPMAGGPSTPALVSAASSVGALGFLAAGYKTADAVAAEIAAVRSASQAPFGVNVFVPSAEAAPDASAYREALRPLAEALGVEPGEPRPDDDGWDAKLALLIAERVPVASFTFGLPPREAVDALHAVDVFVVASAASVTDALLAAELGVDAVALQGVQAGGHRATLTAADEPNELGVLDMLPRLRDLRLPVIAAGGFATGHDIATALEAGASAVQVGTALLLADEAGTSGAHRAALASPDFTDTALTRCFTGRPARGLANAFMSEHPDAPAAYPAVHQITSPIRKAAAARGDLQHVHLWAGTGWREARPGPAADLLWALWEDTIRAHQGG